MIKSKLSNPIIAALLACFCCLLWGSAFPVIKISYSLLDISANEYSSQILFAGMRFTLAGVLIFIFAGVLSRSVLTVKKSGLYKIPVLALFQTILQYLFFYIGLANTTGTKSSVIDSVSVFFSVLIACLFLKQEKLTFTKVSGCLLGFAGVIIINLSGASFGGFNLLGDGFIILSALSYSISTNMIKSYSVNDNPVSLSAYQFMLGGVVMMIIGFLLGGRVSLFNLKAVLLFAYLAFLSAFAYTLWGILLKYNDVSRISVFGFMIPVFGCILSILLLNEKISENAVSTIISLVLVSVGIFIVNKKNKKAS